MELSGPTVLSYKPSHWLADSIASPLLQLSLGTHALGPCLGSLISGSVMEQLQALLHSFPVSKDHSSLFPHAQGFEILFIFV